MYRLMIKEHNVTGLKYLCITKKENWERYSGSGSYWLRHLKRHGFDFKTTLLYESEDYEDFEEKCIFYSSYYDVAMNEEFANLVPERGYCENRVSNVEWWTGYISSSIGGADLLEKHSESIERTRAAVKERWKDVSIEERRELTALMRARALEFFKNKDSEEYKKYVERQSRNSKERFSNTPFNVISDRNRKQRLSMTPEAREKRKKKIQDYYASGAYDHVSKKFSEERVGIDNPAAKCVSWYGEIMTLSQLKELMKKNNLKKSFVDKLLDEGKECHRLYERRDIMYEELVCQHCGKSSNGKKPSTFKRWHFDNCKEAKNA